MKPQLVAKTKGRSVAERLAHLRGPNGPIKIIAAPLPHGPVAEASLETKAVAERVARKVLALTLLFKVQSALD